VLHHLVDAQLRAVEDHGVAGELQRIDGARRVQPVAAASATLVTAAGSAGSRPSRSTAQVTARYMAPVSR
jgi:hypothetical protein